MAFTDCGTLYGVSVGPGDFEQMTLGAVRCLSECEVVLLPAASRESCFAYGIAVQACPEIAKKEIRCFPFPMTRDFMQLTQSWNEIYEEVLEILKTGKDAAFLVIGDATVYSTFSYIAERARQDRIRCEWVNGVTSFCACAGKLQIPLVSEEEDLHIISGDSDWEKALQLSGTKVFMKLGKRLSRLKEILRSYAASGEIRVYAVSYCGMEQEHLYFDLDEIPDEAGYLTTIIVK